MSPKLLSFTFVASLIVSATCQLGTSGPLPEMVRNASCQGGTVVTPNFGVGSYDCVKAQYGHLHGNITAFWYEYWKPLYYAQAYPFTGYADIDDFEPVFETLIKKNITTGYDDRWPPEWIPTLDNLISQADALIASVPNATAVGGNATAIKAQAQSLYLRAQQVGHIGHYPIITDSVRQQIFDRELYAYYAGGALFSTPIVQKFINHTHAANGDGATIPVTYRDGDPNIAKGKAQPTIIFITGLDGFRADIPTKVQDTIYQNGWAVIVVEMPGTASCPANRTDPTSAERLWDSVLDWVDQQPQLDSNKTVAWANSAGGYYGLRIAHTHAKRLIAAVGQAGWSHFALTPTWFDIMGVGEYPMDLARGMMLKFGYANMSEMYAKAFNDYSLVANGIVNMSHTKLVVVNGMDDTIFPVEDSMLMQQYGVGKTSRFQPYGKHMGEPAGSQAIFAFLEDVLM